ncbi:HlyD family secretion protein [Phyllobacterium bourgognense]|uniref:HlyD family secretion protein n=1 Tax=Phyllobacterium bourgognense TaxID=314236 RepID=UPI001FE0878B|nr:HlyD family secretion protein [Phyllobacterium bourgognense]
MSLCGVFACETLVVEAKVQPQDVDQLFVGRPAGLPFTAFSQRTTPEVNGTVQQISADVTTDTRTGLSHHPRRGRAAWRNQTRTGDAPRNVYQDWRQERRILFHQANDRSGKAAFREG